MVDTEDVPYPLPRDRWLADPAASRSSKLSFQAVHSLLEATPTRYHPSWTIEMNERAVCSFHTAMRSL